MTMLRTSALLLGLAVALPLVSDAQMSDGDLHTASVAAFKNGLAFVVKQGSVPLDGSTGRIGPVPAASLGSLWIAPSDAGTSLEEVVAYRYMVSMPQNLTALADVLLANAGKTVTVVDNNQKEYTGEIVGFRQAPPATDLGPQAPASTELYSALSNSIVPAPPAAVSPEFLVLKSEGRRVALYFRNLVRVALPADLAFERNQQQERRALRFRIKGTSGRANVTMGYLENGVGWTPSYLVTLKDDKVAQITMQAVLVNDVEELKDADISFVVGVPNFAYAHILSPMALQQNLMDFMRSANERDNRQAFSNALLGQRAIGGLADAGNLEASVSASFEELQGAPEEDLFLYSRKGVTLAKGERGTYNVFSDTVNYEHVYVWDVQNEVRVDGFGNVQNNPGNAADQVSKNNVWHTLRLKNTTKFPWTSAPSMVISGAQPVSQDTVPYTPKGASSDLKLTIATDIRASREEKEVARLQEVQRRKGYSYDQVTVEGILKIKNYKSKDVRLTITSGVRGTVESQTDSGKAEKLAEAIAVDNPLSRLTWDFTLKAGEEKAITYRYKVWVRV